MLRSERYPFSESRPNGSHGGAALESAGGIRYRPDVDGLRAVAIIPVVAFHAGFGGMPGGFTGVDVFFVISGYLIGAQIFRQSTSGAFRYLSFYARRLKRIIPALVALLLVLVMVGWFLLTPSEMRELGKETVAAAFGTSNLLFYLGGDYFAPAADYNPLLHTWSLGVEEQFYIILPVLAAVLIRRLRAPASLSLFVLTLASLLGSFVLTEVNPQAAFYLLPTRFWELSLGALLATLRLDVSPKVRGIAGQSIGFGGAILIATGIFAYRPEFGFPGVFVLLPTIGAAMLIASRTSWVNRYVLANPVAVFVGKVSYSWYLWHWPLFYLVRVIGIDGHVDHWFVAAVSLALAVVSWRVVEQPFRRRRGQSDRSVVARYVATITCVASLGLLVYQQDGFPSRLPAAVRISAEDAQRTQDDPCLLRRGSVETTPTGCRYAPTNARAVAIVGDSHGASIAPGWERAASLQGLGFRQLTKSNCTGQWGYSNTDGNSAEFIAECLEYQAAAFEQIANDPGIRVVVLASRWSAEQRLVAAPGSPIVDLETALDVTLAKLERLGRQIVLVQDVPNFAFDPYALVVGEALPLRSRLRRALGAPEDNGGAPVTQVEVDGSRAIIEKLAAKHAGVVLVDPWARLCHAGQCQYRGDDGLYYFDSQHLTGVGAMRAVGRGPDFGT